MALAQAVLMRISGAVSCARGELAQGLEKQKLSISKLSGGSRLLFSVSHAPRPRRFVRLGGQGRRAPFKYARCRSHRRDGFSKLGSMPSACATVADRLRPLSSVGRFQRSRQSALSGHRRYRSVSISSKGSRPAWFGNSKARATRCLASLFRAARSPARWWFPESRVLMQSGHDSLMLHLRCPGFGCCPGFGLRFMDICAAFYE